jgi:hypothetical protein
MNPTNTQTEISDIAATAATADASAHALGRLLATSLMALAAVSMLTGTIAWGIFALVDHWLPASMPGNPTLTDGIMLTGAVAGGILIARRLLRGWLRDCVLPAMREAAGELGPTVDLKDGPRQPRTSKSWTTAGINAKFGCRGHSPRGQRQLSSQRAHLSEKPAHSLFSTSEIEILDAQADSSTH